MSLLKNIKENWLILFILLVGIAFRFIPINQYQFSHDELSGLSRTIFPTIGQEIDYGIKIDAHPALIQLFLWFWVKLFGYSEIAIKLPFLLCGVLSIWVVYRFAKNYLSEAAAIVSATFLACSFIFILYSSYARMYSPGILFSLLVLESVFKIVFIGETKTKDYVFYILWFLACAYTHHMSCLFAIVVSVLSMFYINKNDLRKFIIYGVLAFILYLPHLSITLYQLSVGGIGFSTGGWLAKPGADVIYHFVKTLLGCGISGKLIIVLFFGLTLISVFRLNAISKKQMFLLWIFLINYIIIFCYSIFRNPILQYSVLLFSGVALILFLSSFASFLKPKQIMLLCLGLMTLMSFQTIRKKHFFSKVNQHEFETQVQVFQKMQRLVGKENVAYVSGSERFFMYVYEKKYNSNFQYLYTHDSTFLQKDRLTAYLKNLKQSYIVLCGVGAGTIQQVKQYFPYIVSNTDDYFSNVTVLSKYDYGYYDVSVLYTTGLLNSDINIYIDSTKTIAFKKDAFEFKITPQDSTYPFGVSIPIKKTLVVQHQYLIGELSFMSKQDSINSTDEFCASIIDANGKSFFYTSVKLKDFYNGNKQTQKALVDIFAGSEFKKWYKADMSVNFFIKKGKKSNYTVTNFNLKVADYNPTKWTLWN
jgi:hypothetical protein